MSDVGITSIWVSASRQKRLTRGDRSAHSDRRAGGRRCSLRGGRSNLVDIAAIITASASAVPAGDALCPDMPEEAIK